MAENKTYYFTFGQAHPLKDGWIEISSTSEIEAKNMMVMYFGIRWASMYDESDFAPAHFPAGRWGNIIEIL